MLVPVGDVLGPVGERQDHVSQRRQGQALSSAPLSGPADVRLAAAQVQDMEAAPAGH